MRQFVQPRFHARFLVTVTTVLAVPVAGLAVAGAPTAMASATASAAASTATAAEAPADVTEQPDAVSAMVSARELDHPVEDLSQRSETTKVLANPDGSWTRDEASGPVRTLDDVGEWADIDTDLVALDDGGGYVPRNAIGDLVISSGGDKTTAAMNVKDRVLRWQWPTTLPAPVIEGNTATYADAVAGGDLVLTATPSGFSQDIVLREAPATEVSFKVPVLTGGPKFTEGEQGDLAITTAAGDDLVTAPQPVMYDSSEDAVGDPQNTAPVEVAVTKNTGPNGGGTLTLSPDQGFLTDPATVYPVTVDPAFTSYALGDTWITNVDTTSHVASEDLRVGSINAGDTKSRTFMNFGDGRWAGKIIDHAELRMSNFYAVSCIASSVQASRITEGWAKATVTWPGPSVTADSADNYAPAHGFTGCPTADAVWDIGGIVQDWANGAAPLGIGLKAVSETSANGYRRYRSTEYSAASSATPRITVTYTDPPPPAVTDVSVAACEGPCGAPPVVNGIQPTFTAKDTLAGWQMLLQVRAPGAGSDLYDSPATATSGGTGTIQVPAGKLTSGNAYEYRIGASDGAATTWTSWSAFSIDSAPSVPQDLDVSPCSPCTAPAVVTSLRPRFSGTSADDVDKTLRYRVEVRQQGQTTVVSAATGAPSPSGGEGGVRLETPLSPGTAYEYRLGAVDALHSASFPTTTWTPFTTDGQTATGTVLPPALDITSDTTWTRANSPYVINQVQVATGATLTIEPGVVVKVATTDGIYVEGTLVASGTKAAPIVITSVKDDTESGDSNGDGSASVPAPGDYRTAINFVDPSTDALALARPTSVLRNVSIRYGASGVSGGSACNGLMSGALQFSSRTRLLMEHSEFLNAKYNNMLPTAAIDRTYGAVSVRLSRFGPTLSGCDVAMAGWGDFYGNVFESGSNLGGLWAGGMSAVHSSFESNWFLGCVCLSIDYGNQPTRWHWNFEGNAFMGGVYDAWNVYPDDMSGNYWGTPPPTGLKVDPSMSQPPKWLNPGLESDPAPAPTLTEAQTYGSGSGEFGQVPYGYQADPVNSVNGSYHDNLTDASVPALGIDLDLTRSYNSADTSTGSLGKGWTFAYDAALSFPTTQTVRFRAPDGQQIEFIRSGTAFVAPPGVTASLSQDATGYSLTTRGEDTYRFDLAGQLTKQQDNHANTVTFTYDANGHLATAANGPRSLAFTYTGSHLSTVTLPDTHTIGYGYTDDLLTSVTDQATKTTTYAYTPGGKLASETDPLNHEVMRLAYDPGTGRVSDQWDALDNHTAFAWNPITSTSTMTDPRGNAWVDKYDGSALVERTDPEGRTWHYTRDDKLQLIRTTNPAGTLSIYDYNDNGDMVRYEGPTGPVSTRYDTDHHAVRTVNARGNVTEMSYSPLGDLLQINRPPSAGSTAATTESFTYFASGLLKTSSNADLKTTSYAYTAAGDPWTVTSPGGSVTTTTYVGGVSGMGRTATEQAPGKPTATSFTYDAVGRIKTVTDPLARVVADNTYNDAGQLISAKDAKLRTTGYAYDEAGQLLSVTTPDTNAQPLGYTYDANGNRKTASDAAGKTLNYSYNNANEVTAVDGPQGHWEVARTKLGAIDTLTAPDQTETEFGYTPAGQISSVNYPGGTAKDVSYSYDPDGNRATMTYDPGTGGSQTTSYLYDNLDQLTTVTRGSSVVSYAYTKSGLLQQLTYPNPTPTQVGYTYDDDGQLKTVKKATTLEATYAYSPSGMLTTAAIGAGAGAFQRTYTYDDADRLSRLQDVKANSNVILDDTYGYDATDNPTQITHANASKDTYTYDVSDQLTGACYNTTTCTGATDSVKWTYDTTGNRTSEIRPSGTATYDYNATTGRLSSITGNGLNRNFTYNTLGQVTNDGQADYTYDGAGHTATETRGSATTTYTYDGDGQRLKATSPTTTTQSSWDPLSHELLAELDGTGTLTAQYLYGMGQLTRTTGTGATSYLHADAQGSIRALTDPQGATTESAEYEPFGVLRSSSPTAPTQPLGFAGQYTDPSGLQHLRARQYDSTTGRFTAPDPLGGPGADPNYSYANNNPMVYGDPSGMIGVPSFVKDMGHSIVQAAPIVATVASVAALFPPLAPIAGPIALVAGAITAVDAMANAAGECIGGKGSCGRAILEGAATAALGFGIGKAARYAYRGVQVSGAAETLLRSEGRAMTFAAKSPKEFITPTNLPSHPPARLPDGYKVRVQGPTADYPSGYWRVTNQHGQYVDPATMKPPGNVSKAMSRAMTHVEYPG